MKENLKDIILKPRFSLDSKEYETIKQCAEQFPAGLTEREWNKAICRAIDEVEHNEGVKCTLELIEKAHEELNRVYPQMFEEKSKLLKKACMLCLQENLIEDAHKKMEDYLYDALSQVQYNAVNASMPFYSFRSFSTYSLDDIEKETISLAHPREFNDPLDTILVYWLNDEIKNNSANEIQLKYRLLMKKVAEHIKIRCLIAGIKDDGQELPVEDLNVLMWSHYANSHKGFCVRYEFDSDVFDPSKSLKRDKVVLVDKIKYSKTIKISKEPSIRKALFEKSDFWKYEKEMRLLSFDCSGNDKEFPVIGCKGAAKAIYLGARCSDANRRQMEKAIGDKNIPLYQMVVDEEKLTRFKKILIG